MTKIDLDSFIEVYKRAFKKSNRIAVAYNSYRDLFVLLPSMGNKPETLLHVCSGVKPSDIRETLKEYIKKRNSDCHYTLLKYR